MSHTEYSEKSNNPTQSDDEDDGNFDNSNTEPTANGPQQIGHSFDHTSYNAPNFFPLSSYEPRNLSDVTHVDPAMQLQFYESRMRDHAMAYAQYANAAAGAALAAAQLASSTPIYRNILPDPSSFYPGFHPSIHSHNISPPFPAPSIGYVPSSFTYFSADSNYRKGSTSHERQSNNQVHSTKKQKRTMPHHQKGSDSTENIQSSNTEDCRRTRSKREQTSIPDIIPSNSISSSGMKKRNKVSIVHSKSRLMSMPMKALDVSGKSAVRALYEICDKRRWSSPQFVEYDVSFNSNTGSSSSAYLHNDFIMGLEINGVELSKSRGASKKSAQKDAARKALSKLFPGTVFDVYGILLDLGKLDLSDDIFKSAGGKTLNQEEESAGGVSDEVGEDLAPNLASRLAIIGDNHEDRLSPTPSEDSSISTTFSLKKNKVSIVSGGPFHESKCRPYNMFPSASTTSGASSASEDVDDDEYLMTRGASICSMLLNVMVQIDDRILEQPTYSFDICTCVNDTKGSNTSKRKGVELHEADGATMSKRRTATKNGKLVTLQQTSFACTATLYLHEPKTRRDKNDSSEENDESLKCLRAVGTGTTKRSARHIASAKLLSLLFPECNGMAEVKAAAEAAQERYVSKRTGKRIGHEKFTTHHFSRKDVDHEKDDSYMNILHMFKPRTGIALSDSFLQKIIQVTRRYKKSKDPPGSDLAKLSLSETKQECLNNDPGSNCDSILAVSSNHKERIDSLVDEALDQMSLNEDEVKAASGCVEVNDLCKIVLRRATIEDSKDIRHLLEKINHSQSDHDLTNMCVDKASYTKNSYKWLESSTIWNDNHNCLVLLLHRSDEVLGCAILLLGFSFPKGQNLRLIDIFHKEHYPKERFMDCLSTFADFMHFPLVDQNTQKSPRVQFSRHFLSRFIEKQIQICLCNTATDNTTYQLLHEKQPIRKPLQVVEEDEEEEGEDDEKSDHIHKKRLKVN